VRFVYHIRDEDGPKRSFWVVTSVLGSRSFTDEVQEAVEGAGGYCCRLSWLWGLLLIILASFLAIYHITYLPT
jgi:hypothetical protein